MDIRKIIREEVNEFEWVDDIDVTVPYVGMKFTGHVKNPYTKEDVVSTVKQVSEHMVVFWNDGRNFGKRPYKDFINKLKSGVFKVAETMKESNDFDWVKEHEFTHEEVIQHIKDNNLTEWTFGEHWGGDLNLWGTPITSLGNLQSVGGDLYLLRTKITSLGNLQSVGGNLDLEGTPITNLGNLESVGGGLYLRGTPITNLGNLESVGGGLYLRGTPISETHSEEQIRQSVQVGGDIYM